jgi:hypothetical protein
MERSRFSDATRSLLASAPVLLLPRGRSVGKPELKSALYCELRSRLSLLFPFVKRARLANDEIFSKIVFLRNNYRRVFLANIDRDLESIFERHDVLNFDNFVNSRCEVDFCSHILRSFRMKPEDVRSVLLRCGFCLFPRSNWEPAEFEDFCQRARIMHLERVRRLGLEGSQGTVLISKYDS